MVSSVFVELMSDAGEEGTRTTECGEVGNCISGRDVALGVGEEGITGMKVEMSLGHRS